MMRRIDILKKIVEAWNKIPARSGPYTELERWLKIEMLSAIELAEAELAEFNKPPIAYICAHCKCVVNDPMDHWDTIDGPNRAGWGCWP